MCVCVYVTYIQKRIEPFWAYLCKQVSKPQTSEWMLPMTTSYWHLRVIGLVILGQSRRVDWLYWDQEAERLTGLVILEQRHWLDWLYLDREAGWTGYIEPETLRGLVILGPERLTGLVILGQSGWMDWFYWDRAPELTGYTRTETLNWLVILGQRHWVDCLY